MRALRRCQLAIIRQRRISEACCRAERREKVLHAVRYACTLFYILLSELYPEVGRLTLPCRQLISSPYAYSSPVMTVQHQQCRLLPCPPGALPWSAPSTLPETAPYREAVFYGLPRPGGDLFGGNSPQFALWPLREAQSSRILRDICWF